MYKTCPRCRKCLPVEQFGNCKSNNDGLFYYCKTCEKNMRSLRKDKIKAYRHKYNRTRTKENAEYSRKYRLQHPERISGLQKKYRARRKANPLYKLADQLRINLASHINKKRGYTKKTHTYEILGCEYEFFMLYLGERPSEDAQLDHICPCAQAQNEEELLKLQHYSNFRWLTKQANVIKGSKWTIEGAYKCVQLLNREWIKSNHVHERSDVV